MGLRILVALLVIFTYGCQNIQEKIVDPFSYNEILFVKGRLYPPFKSELWAMDRNGGNQTRLLSTTGCLEIGGVSWSPDGKKIATIMYSFSKHKKCVCEIWIIEIEKEKIIKKNILKINKIIGSTISWSPDSKKIAFEMDGIIYIIDSNGESLRQITEKDSSSQYPSWSPDGKKIIFQCVHAIDRYWKIYMMDVNGTNIERVTNNPTYIKETTAIWSPDGKWIAFQEENREKKVKIGERNYIVLIKLETKERKKLIPLFPSIGFIPRMCFSPDSKKIALEADDIATYKKYGCFNYEIYTIDIDGKDIKIKNLTNTPNWNEECPSWRPITKD